MTNHPLTQKEIKKLKEHLSQIGKPKDFMRQIEIDKERLFAVELDNGKIVYASDQRAAVSLGAIIGSSAKMLKTIEFLQSQLQQEQEDFDYLARNVQGMTDDDLI